MELLEKLQDEDAIASESDVQVIHGASVQFLPLAGVTIAHARPLLQTILGIDPQSPVLVKGRRVGLRYTIAPGDALEFVHHAGEKGSEKGDNEKGRAEWIYASRSRRNRSFAVRTAQRRFPHR